MYRRLKCLIVLLPALFFLGCYFEGHNSLTINPTGVTSIAVSPNPIKVADGGDLQLSASATVITAEGKEITIDITQAAKWRSLNTGLVDFDTSLGAGVLSGYYTGSSDVTQIIVTYEGVESDPVDVEVCQLNQDCLMQKIVDSSGVYITSSPSLDYVNGIDNPPSYDSAVSDFSGGSSYGQFIAMTWAQANNWCDYLSSIELEGRNNWLLYEEDIYDLLYAAVGNFYSALGWPITYSYWTSDAGLVVGDYVTYHLNDGSQSELSQATPLYASCISTP